MPRGSDDPATSTTHIRVAHIGALCRTIDFYRAKADLPAIQWTDNPVSTTTHFRCIHFTELRSAVQDLWTHAGLGTLPHWSMGSAPSSSRQTSAGHQRSALVDAHRRPATQYLDRFPLVLTGCQ